MTTTGRAALVTGGGRGIGRATAVRLAREGWRVGVLARTAAELDATVAAAEDEGGSAAAFPADVLDPTGLGAAVARFGEWAGGLDALVCCAGRWKAVGPFDRVDPDDWWLDFETAVRGFSNTVRATLPALRASHSASVSVLVGPGHNGELPFASAYGAAQAGLVRLVESLTKELSADGVHVYAVNPGFVPTALTRRLTDTPEGRRWLPQFNEALAEGKEVGPEVAAEILAWLAADRPAALSGRVAAALQTPAVLESRLERIRSENLGVLRLR